MPSQAKSRFLQELERRCGTLKKLSDSQSMFEAADGQARVYIRYSKTHGKRTFFGLRKQDLLQLQGLPSFIAFLWDDQEQPLLIPFEEYEEVFQSTEPARDGQYKAQVYLRDAGSELYVANAGRFNVESHFGWAKIEALVDPTRVRESPTLGHSQVQTLLGAIGSVKGYEIWVPTNNRDRLDWSVCDRFDCTLNLPVGYESASHVLEEIDVLWVQRASGQVAGLFEVEHSTPIYSGLLRLNDIHLLAPRLEARFSIVGEDDKRDLFVRQLRRPTFRMSGLIEKCNFLEYVDVFEWHRRVCRQ